ncbi:hypothetical protein JMUB5695_00730 [Mycobacterium heckeshornense]|uniref:hypothetical protein n=1 Tax=Mycobacterium heckeshornense TaxID=110505 RepID=UPI001942D3C6|nr:hypothetical protein [Mycobacterium heckeshornense]BCQ07309.1 hypothetical protein JMUB5695_00730 [Mycobacterium heckeshornense]
MIPRLSVALSAAAVMGLIGVGPGGVAHAAPSGDEGTGQCSFSLTPPKVVQVSGASMVLATMRPGPCTIHASPNSSVVCLSIQGDGTAGQCASKSGRNPALAYYPYRPGSTYIVKGIGCVNTFKPPYEFCQNFGPSQANL